MSNINITQHNFNRFSRRLQKILQQKTDNLIGYTESQEILSQTLGLENLHEMQQALKKDAKSTHIPIISQIKSDFLENFRSDCARLTYQFPDVVGLVQARFGNDKHFSKIKHSHFIIRIPLKNDILKSGIRIGGSGNINEAMTDKIFERNLDINNKKFNGLKPEIIQGIRHLYSTYIKADGGEFLEACFKEHVTTPQRERRGF